MMTWSPRYCQKGKSRGDTAPGGVWAGGGWHQRCASAGPESGTWGWRLAPAPMWRTESPALAANVGNLQGVPNAIALSKATIRNIHQGDLFWALLTIRR
ncbi:hypothetical protein KCP76_15470 [Salmonella enterica subsp. enterica serovar Weltevreden]|nr:hypothetical protein KCP76_15470 [Salmonella enterica subsp. enterica serovar Weltevreden]